MNTKLFFIAIAIVATFSIAVTAITTNVSAQNTTEGNMTSDNMTSMTSNLTMGTGRQVYTCRIVGSTSPPIFIFLIWFLNSLVHFISPRLLRRLTSCYLLPSHYIMNTRNTYYDCTHHSKNLPCIFILYEFSLNCSTCFM